MDKMFLDYLYVKLCDSFKAWATKPQISIHEAVPGQWEGHLWREKEWVQYVGCRDQYLKTYKELHSYEEIEEKSKKGIRKVLRSFQ